MTFYTIPSKLWNIASVMQKILWTQIPNKKRPLLFLRIKISTKRIVNWTYDRVVPYTSATSTPIAIADNELLKLPNPSQSHLTPKQKGFQNSEVQIWIMWMADGECQGQENECKLAAAIVIKLGSLIDRSRHPIK